MQKYDNTPLKGLSRNNRFIFNIYIRKYSYGYSELQSFIAVFYFTGENRAEIFEYEYDFSLQQTE